MLKINNAFLVNNFLKINNYLNNKNNKISKIILLLDKNVKEKYLNFFIKKIPILVNSKVIIIKSGEKYKNLFISIKILKFLLLSNIDKNAILINIGGGVITDLGGFIASIYKRGIRFINIPTTLLGIIDASIGGKNSVNLNNYKNEIGLIKKPIFILIYNFFLKTLSKKEIFSGLGELLKYGLIYDKELWNYLKKINFYNYKNIIWDKIIYKSILIKQNIVKKDPNEKLGLRKILNFGHTIGHAIESFFLKKKKKITHGESIALGMICESWLSKKKNKLSKKEYIEICHVILKYFKIRKIKKKYFNIILNYIKNDKKNYNNNINFSLLRKIGKCDYDKKIDTKLIIKSIKIMNKIINYE
ncbi:MAG: 3-dehydroquinate synthase [Candidatus Shikimatogenerans sp. JK-2022]|nr:3-dehydroquinate synthase [Candidatus Shikimatogenerans bostrichidophilus]